MILNLGVFFGGKFKTHSWTLNSFNYTNQKIMWFLKHPYLGKRPSESYQSPKVSDLQPFWFDPIKFHLQYWHFFVHKKWLPKQTNLLSSSQHVFTNFQNTNLQVFSSIFLSLKRNENCWSKEEIIFVIFEHLREDQNKYYIIFVENTL